MAAVDPFLEPRGTRAGVHQYLGARDPSGPRAPPLACGDTCNAPDPVTWGPRRAALDDRFDSLRTSVSSARLGRHAPTLSQQPGLFRVRASGHDLIGHVLVARSFRPEPFFEFHASNTRVPMNNEQINSQGLTTGEKVTSKVGFECLHPTGPLPTFDSASRTWAKRPHRCGKTVEVFAKAFPDSIASCTGSSTSLTWSWSRLALQAHTRDRCRRRWVS